MNGGGTVRTKTASEVEAGHHDEMIRWFEEEVSERAGELQRETLKQILELNYGVEYLRRWFGDTKSKKIEIRDVDPITLESIYASTVPLISHADIEPYMDRIASGDSSPLLTQQPITHLSLSSGTTEGRQKYVPFNQHSADTTLQISRLSAAYRSRVYPTREGGKILEFIYRSKQFKTKGGITAGTATTHYFSSKQFKLRQQQTNSYTCSPDPVISSGDTNQSTYCHLLLGLFHSDEIQYITSVFAYTMVQALTSFQHLWRDLCRDLEEGTLSSDRVTIPSVRQAVLAEIGGKGKPSLAATVRERCRELEMVDWYGVVPEIWRNARYACCIMTGSMEPYVGKLRHFVRDLGLVCTEYGSTESWIGLNVDPTAEPWDVSFAVVPTFSYFEFIPLFDTNTSIINQDDHYCDHGFDVGWSTTTSTGGSCYACDDFIEGPPVPLSKVKVGQPYELVLTTYTGLYRYRLGDMVEVTGFLKGTPKLKFLCRRKLILTINIDKNTEKDLQVVVKKASQLLLLLTPTIHTAAARGSSSTPKAAELVDFTSHANTTTQPGHYVIYWEIKGEATDGILQQCCDEMDASFVDPGYVVSRASKSIGPLELRIVRKGTFHNILNHSIANGAGLSQFKTPRCTSDAKLLDILDSCTIKRYYSTAYMMDVRN